MASRGVATTGIRPRGDADLYSLWRFSDLLRRQAPDAVLLTEWRRAPQSALAAARAGVPRVVLRVGRHRPLPGPGLRRSLLLRFVDRWYVTSEVSRRALLADEPKLGGRLAVIPNGIATPEPAEPLDLREERRLPNDAVVVLAVGTIAPVKGFDLLVGTMADLPPHVHVAIAGDTRRAGPLRERVRALGVEDRVHLLGHRDDLPRLLAGCDLYVLSSRHEGSPPVLLEAIAHGAPAIVATDVPGVREILGIGKGVEDGVVRGRTGWLVRPGDEAALARAVSGALVLRAEDPSGYRALGEAARDRVRLRFGVDRTVEAAEGLLFAPSP
jgi:glycosyltransferase involved in cell wall biosynthesis